jgi:hypothetical protein
MDLFLRHRLYWGVFGGCRRNTLSYGFATLFSYAKTSSGAEIKSSYNNNLTKKIYIYIGILAPKRGCRKRGWEIEAGGKISIFFVTAG